MVAAGLVLYRDIFQQHGPLVYEFGLILDKFTDASFAMHRIMISVFELFIVALMIIYSNGLQSINRLFATIVVTTIMIVLLPEVYGNAFLYQVLAGIFVAIALILAVLPVLTGEEQVAAWRSFVGALLLGSLPFFAFTYIPTAVGLIVCASTRRTWRAVAGGVVAALVLNLVFLTAIGSLTGYLVDHFYLNLVIYPAFDGGISLKMWSSSKHSMFVYAAAAVIFVVGVTVQLVRKEETSIWRGLIFTISLTILLIRGPYMQAVPLYYAILPLVFTASRWIPVASRLAQGVLGVIGLGFVVKMSLILPSDVRRIAAAQVPEHTAFSNLVERFTNKNDKIVSYSDGNLQYMVSHRLPAVPNYFLLPHQVEYEKKPILGVSSHICQDIRDSQPKFVSLDKWLAWGKFPWSSYGACVDSIMEESYVHIDNTTIYVRQDLWPDVKRALDSGYKPGSVSAALP